NVGCIPSKALLRNAEIAHTLRERGKEFGFSFENLVLDQAQADFIGDVTSYYDATGAWTGVADGIPRRFKPRRSPPAHECRQPALLI
ncbi:MAG: hypothetical protein ACXWCX_28740, partial [Burkholderiales bacterium]